MDDPFVIGQIIVTAIGYVLALYLIPKIVLEKREATANLAWILAIALLPYLGALAYFITGRTRIRRHVRRRRLRTTTALRGRSNQ